MTLTFIEERPRRSVHSLGVALAGALSLAVAMGIGRFAFTPLLPMMLSDGVVDLESGSWLATANYFGYLVGALLCMVEPSLRSRYPRLPPMTGAPLVRGGLVATIILTLGMAVHAPAAWPTLRFLAGVASAVVFVSTSGWCLMRLAKLHTPALGGLIYTGPGIGIVVSGLAASGMVACRWSAATGWIVFGLMAVVLTTVVWPTFRAEGDANPIATNPTDGRRTARDRGHGTETVLFTAAYGLAGFGYIIAATFLPVIAREALPGSAWLDLFWPIFGLGVMSGAVLASRVPVSLDPRYLLTCGYVLQGAGVVVILWLPSLLGFALGSLLVGLPLTAISFFAMREARRLRPSAPASFMGLLTAVYGVGQIAGPPFTAAILKNSKTPSAGFTLSLEVAAAALGVGAALYAWIGQAYPVTLSAERG